VVTLLEYCAARGLPTADEAGARYAKGELVDVILDFLGM